MSRTVTDVKLTDNLGDQVPHMRPRSSVNVIDASRRIHHECQVDRSVTRCIVRTTNDIFTSQLVAKRLRCNEIFSNSFIVNLQLTVSVTEF